MAPLLILAVPALIAAHAWSLARRRRWLAFEPLNAFWAGAVAVYVLQPWSLGQRYIEWHKDGVLEETLLWVLFGLGWVVVGYETSWGRRLARHMPHIAPELDTKRGLVGGGVLIGAGLFGSSYLVATGGGLSEWASVGRGGTDWSNVSGYMAQLENLLPVGIALVFYVAWNHADAKWIRILATSMAGAQCLWLFYLGTRSRTVGLVTVLLASWYLPRRKNPSLAFLAVGFVVLLSVANFQGAFRDKFVNFQVGEDIDLEEARAAVMPFAGPDESISQRHVGASANAEFNCVMSVIELIPERLEFTYGYSHLEILTRWIPRSMWPDKIYPHARAYTPLMKMASLSTTEIPRAKEVLLMGPSFTYIGHWYSVAGAIGLILAGLGTGSVLRALREWPQRGNWGDGDTIFFIQLIPVGMGEAVGEPLFWIYYLPFSLGPLIIILLLARKRAAVTSGGSKE